MMLSGTAAWGGARVEALREPRGSQLPADPLHCYPPASHVQFFSKPLKGIPWVLIYVRWPPMPLKSWSYMFSCHWSHYPIAVLCHVFDPNVCLKYYGEPLMYLLVTGQTLWTSKTNAIIKNQWWSKPIVPEACLWVRFFLTAVKSRDININGWQ